MFSSLLNLSARESSQINLAVKYAHRCLHMYNSLLCHLKYINIRLFQVVENIWSRVIKIVCFR